VAVGAPGRSANSDPRERPRREHRFVAGTHLRRGRRGDRLGRLSSESLLEHVGRNASQSVRPAE
jgi:hypothetical protein